MFESNRYADLKKKKITLQAKFYIIYCILVTDVLLLCQYVSHLIHSVHQAAKNVEEVPEIKLL